MRIAVTGANGFVGQALCPFLQNRLQADLVSLTRNPSTSANKQLALSATDEELIAGLEGVDCLIHLAARAHTRNSTPDDFERDNLALTNRVADLCVAAKIPRLIYLSSIKVNGNSTNGRPPFSADETPQPEDIYGQSKLASEIAVKERLINSQTYWVIIRPPLVYGDKNKGNLHSLETLIDKRFPLPFDKIHNQRDLVSIENLCELIALCATHPQAIHEIFLVSDGVARSTKEIIQLLADRKHQSPYFFNVPDWVFTLIKKFSPQAIERLTGNLQVNIAKTKSLLGWSPRN
ncbi:UDP-glucose 4-epimerase [Cellvibrio zantedeschiae]|uniref:UDP-glucose 4-epimerase n=1 Tax=Cellvibrio zantedeschiae TaxID=1237077 RepID=A0ABQ3B001_9GAMM|nr:NAD-dependent epimerase/dehydratase family protein [Cellvibrio zantedeschiae]GGY72713.1 UDP-glucose 4-epimerase [Cellvibrio zantedeschiae]